MMTAMMTMITAMIAMVTMMKNDDSNSEHDDNNDDSKSEHGDIYDGNNSEYDDIYDDSNSEHDDNNDGKVQRRCVPGTARCSGKPECTDASDEFEYVEDERMVMMIGIGDWDDKYHDDDKRGESVRGAK